MDLVYPFVLVGVVLALSALVAGLVERAPLSFPMIFLGLGLVLGRTGALRVELDDPALEVVAVLTLALVLFLDAVRLELASVRGDWHVPALTLGPGTLLVVGCIGASAVLLLGLEPVHALLLGAALASTDPVVLRDILRDRRLPVPVRSALGVEAGTNDLIVLPAVLVLAAVARGSVGGAGGWTWFGVQLFVIGPLAGAVVGAGGAWLMSRADARFGVREEYQALYGVGLVLLAYTAGETLGTDGFLACFAAGVAVTLANVRLCDCFLEFGEVVSEMLMLLAFVLFGAVLSGTLGDALGVGTLLLAGLAIFVVRPLAISLVLQVRPRTLSRWAKLYIAWFGPRGLNSLLLALLAVRAGVPGAEALFAAAGVVVLVSVVVHGASATPLAALYGRRMAASTLPEERESTATAVLQPSWAEVPRIEPEELARLLEGDEPPLVVDVSSRANVARHGVRIAGAVRVVPDEVAQWARDQTRDRLVVLYCT